VNLKKSTVELRGERIKLATQRTPITVACLWPKKGVNLGTLARSCDAIGAVMVVPSGSEPIRALSRGNTIGMNQTLWTAVGTPVEWLTSFKGRMVAVELARGSIPIAQLHPVDGPTALILGHEVTGVPEWALSLCDEIVEIPMGGVGNSLNVAVAGSLALYKLAGVL